MGESEVEQPHGRHSSQERKDTHSEWHLPGHMETWQLSVLVIQQERLGGTAFHDKNLYSLSL